jgi:phosphatidylserine/phosphatidylglycerophosphate/cardiolipin synthase-like enzyme
MIGSYNCGSKSAYCDDECALVIKDPLVTDAVNTSLDKDAQHSTEPSTSSHPLLRLASAFIHALVGPFFG